MSRSLRTDPYPIRAARRARPVEVRVCPPRPGFIHPAGAADVARALAVFGPTVRYGVRRVELRQRTGALVVATLRVPGVVLMFEQPHPPWLIPGRLTAGASRRLLRAGAEIQATASVTRVDWPAQSLRDFMLFDGLMHEIGHHVIQHRTGKRGARVMRTADHERRADAFAAECRLRWT